MSTDITIPTTITSLAGYEPYGPDLVTNYWTPSHIGDYKSLIFLKIEIEDQVNEETGETSSKPTAFLYDPSTQEVWRNSSSRLIAALERAKPERGQAMHIEYKGKIKNSTNAFQSDDWSIRFMRPISK
jgi:hypothetical protein